MNSGRRATLLAWIAFGVIVASLAASHLANLIDPEIRARMGLEDHLWPLVPISFALVGALIASRHPRNTIGLLLFLPGVLFAVPSQAYLLQFPTAPASPSLLFLLVVWVENWGWLLLIMPILLTLLLFPTGRPPGPRWRWVIRLALVMSGVLIAWTTFVREWGTPGLDLDWTVRNPIGFVPASYERIFLVLWAVALPTLTLLCAASLVVRYRRARAVERQQIRWLLFGAGIFVASYLPVLLSQGFGDPGALWGGLFVIGLVAIPTSIAIAILRHRLYDIDVIIRRTLQYGVLTGILVGLYAGSVLLFQTVLGPLVGGADSPPVVIVTTLLLAALFNPLRVRVQRFIDRRFYRSKVDAERALARFAALARSEVDLDQLRRALLGTVGETFHPETMGLWLRASPRRTRSEVER